MRPSRFPARLRRLLLAAGSWLAVVQAAAALEVQVSREALPDEGPLLGLALLELDGPEAFGGLSALLWHEPDRLLLASDRGRLFDARLHRDEAGALADLSEWRSHEVPLPGGWRRDVEGLALGAGQLLVSIEAPPHVVRFAGPLARPERVISYFTQGELGFRVNAGFEALADLPGDDWIALAETVEDGFHPAFTRAGGRLRYVAAEGFAPTGADRQGDRLFVLERHVSLLGGWQARLTCLPLSALDGFAPLRPVELARLGVADGIDNMEGLAVRTDGDDLEFLLVSDDNQQPFQRTVLLHYRWPEAASGGCRP